MENILARKEKNLYNVQENCTHVLLGNGRCTKKEYPSLSRKKTVHNAQKKQTGWLNGYVHSYTFMAIYSGDFLANIQKPWLFIRFRYQRLPLRYTLLLHIRYLAG